MLGDNAVYLAKQIASFDLINMDRDKQVSTIRDNEIIVRSFMLAIEDMNSILFKFVGNDRRLNLYGFKIKFDSIESIAIDLCSIIKDGMIWRDVVRTDFTRIAEDLETIATILDHEIAYNMDVIHSRSKEYHSMTVSV